MPSQPKKPYKNLLEVLEFTGAYALDKFVDSFHSNAPNGVAYKMSLNDLQSYHVGRKKHHAYPLQFAINRHLFHRVQFLFEQGATHEIRGYQAFATLVAANAPLTLLHYCIQNNKCHDNEKYPSLFAAYRQPDYPLEKFEAIHEYCFGLSFEAILLEKKSLYMSQIEFDNKIKLYSQELTRCALLKERLKLIYLNIIKHNPDYKSHLKINLIFGRESPVVNFLKTNQDSVIQNTKEFQRLQAMLKVHTLRENDITSIRLQLNGRHTPNQALAGLYFANCDFSEKADYRLFTKHLVEPRKTFDQHTQCNFKRLLENYLNNDEMAKLKQNCLRAIENSRRIRQDFKKELEEHLTKSPMGTIVRTGTTSRKTFNTGTFAQSIKLCLFGNSEKPVRQAEPPAEAPAYLYAPPAYNPEFRP